MNKEIICDKCNRELTKIENGEIYYKAIEKTIVRKKKFYNIYGFKIAVNLKEEISETIYRYCKDCFKNSKESIAGVS